MAISSWVPYLNNQIAYYLEIFECKFSFKFNSFLQIESDRSYDVCLSGGERKRTDLAIMFAIHDLHENIYSQQCNLLVFDEYDRSLDKSGINAFVNLLFSNFTNKGLTILVISHSDQMRDMFPTKIIVNKDAGYSQIEEIR